MSELTTRVKYIVVCLCLYNWISDHLLKQHSPTFKVAKASEGIMVLGHLVLTAELGLSQWDCQRTNKSHFLCVFAFTA